MPTFQALGEGIARPDDMTDRMLFLASRHASQVMIHQITVDEAMLPA
ncbi:MULTISPECIES: hypothetical protein [Agrobacterium]|nr:MULTISPECIES: hypothetical protein [Agrobacterium]WCK05211.1 hypothetical protein G6L31_021670 [Agrobacterium tumefaciens]